MTYTPDEVKAMESQQARKVADKANDLTVLLCAMLEEWEAAKEMKEEFIPPAAVRAWWKKHKAFDAKRKGK